MAGCLAKVRWSAVAIALGLGAAGAAPAQVPLKVGPELPVNTFVPGNQTHPSAAAGGDGGAIVVWSSDGASPEHPAGLYGRRFNALGVPGAEFRIDSGIPSYPPIGRVAADRAGNFVVVWSGRSSPNGMGGVILARRYDRLGHPLSGEIEVSTSAAPVLSSPGVAMDAAGGFVVAWAATDPFERGRILARPFSSLGQPVAGEIEVSTVAPGTLRVDGPNVAADPQDGFLVAWTQEGTGATDAFVLARRFDGQGNPRELPLIVRGGQLLFDDRQAHAVPLFTGSAGFSVAWLGVVGAAQGTFAQRLTATGAPLGEPVLLRAGFLYPTSVTISPAPAGGALLAWSEYGPDATDVLVRSFDGAWQPRGEALRVNSFVALDQFAPALAVSPTGDVVIAWESGVDADRIPVLPPPGTQDGDRLGVYAQRFTTSTCTDDTRLCLGDGGRFQLQVSWKDPHGNLGTGIGRALPLTGDTGAFWFFNPSNVELVVKVLDGRAVNGKFWVFYGALSDVEYDLKVTDTATGEERTYHNPPFQLASRADTSAFPLSAKAAPAARFTAPAISRPEPAPSAAASICSPDPAALCLEGSRFTVAAVFTNPVTGATGTATAVPLGLESGYFWFFSPENVELVVKVLDGRGANGYFWVLYGALSDVEYTITVTDVLTGRQRTYHNPPHTLASHADTTAFSDVR
jgi:hypothetical protein